MHIKIQLKFIIFCIGLGTAITSSLLMMLILCMNMLNIPLLLFEPNKILSLFEIGLLILAIASCFVASEIYYQYLRGTGNEKQFATNNRNR